MTSRRQFLGGALATTAAPVFAAPRRRLDILILGGTDYLGPAIVENVLARGHKLTLFNRGITNPGLFPQLERIHGDRDPKTQNLGGLSGSRHWDAVIDVWPDEPSMVTATAQLLAPRAGYYFFMSSIAAYANFDVPGLVETSPSRLQAAGYGGNKARSERALMELTQGRAGIARGSPIMGPRDTSFSFYYWLYKLTPNEPFVAPGDGNDVLQYVDVRDVARWIVDCAERRRPGIYNTFSRPIPFRTFFREAAIGIGGHGRPVWVDGTFLRETEKIHPLDNMPVWHPDRPGFARISAAKAEAAGWTQRPLVQTARDTWASYRTWVPANLTFPQKDGSFEWGISREREQAILADWQRRRAVAVQASTAEAAT